MNSEYTLLIAIAGLTFATALVTIVREWLRTDALSTLAEAGLHGGLAREALETGVGGTHAVETETTTTGPASDRPGLIGDDETALARLCFGWGGGGMLVGLAAGGSMGGFVGALLGSVALSTAAIGGVVVTVILLDRAKLAAARDTAHRAA